MRITKEQKKYYLSLFANECKNYIENLVNLNDEENEEMHSFVDQYNNHWIIKKNLLGEAPKLIELRIQFSNYGNNIKSQQKGNRIDQASWVYLKGKNFSYKTGKDLAVGKNDGLIIDNLSFQGYTISCF